MLMIRYVTLSVSATCPVRELTSPEVDQSASWQSASWLIHELSSNLLSPLGIHWLIHVGVENSHLSGSVWLCICLFGCTASLIFVTKNFC